MKCCFVVVLVVAINLLLNQSEKCYDLKFQIKLNKLHISVKKYSDSKTVKTFFYVTGAGEDIRIRNCLLDERSSAFLGSKNKNVMQSW